MVARPLTVAFIRLLSVVGLLAAATGPAWYAMIRNDRDMKAWRHEIFSAPEIPGVEIVETGSRFGLQPSTNGNHCDREAWTIYRTELDPDVIEAHLDSWFAASTSQVAMSPRYVSDHPISGEVRVDYWYRFESGADMRCM